MDGWDPDEALARLEAVEAEVEAASVAARSGPAAVHRLASGGVLLAEGPDGRVNRAVGATLAPLDLASLRAIGRWFTHREVPPAVQLAARAHPETVAGLAELGYVPQWPRAVYAGPPAQLRPRRPPARGLEVRTVATSQEHTTFEDVLAGGLGEPATSSDRSRAAATRDLPGRHRLLVVDQDTPVAAGEVTVHGDVGWLGVAATLPGARRRGAHGLLVAARAALAADAGCDLVAVTAATGSVSARNLAGLGLRLVQHQWVVRRRDAS